MPITTCLRCGALYEEPDGELSDEPLWCADRRLCRACAERDRRARERADASAGDAVEPYPYGSRRAPVANGG